MENMDMNVDMTNERDFSDEGRMYTITHALSNGNLIWLSDDFDNFEKYLGFKDIDSAKYAEVRIDEILHKKMLLAPYCGSYYRAQYHGPSPESQPAHVSVQFVDFGNIEDVPVAKLVLAKRVNKNFDSWINLAFPVFFPEMSKIGPATFLKLFYNQKVTVEKDQNGRFKLFLAKPGMDGTLLNVGEFVLNYCK